MNTNEFIKKLFELAASRNCESSEVCIMSGDEFDVSVKDGEIINYSVSSNMGLGFRALVNGKMGYASTQVLDEEALDMLVNGAIGNASVIENEDEQFIFGGSEKYPEVCAYDEKLDTISASDKIAMAKELEKKALSLDPRVRRCEAVEVMSGTDFKRIVNSKGMDVSFTENYIGLYAGVIAEDNGSVTTGSGMQFIRHPEQIDLDKTAKEAVDEAVAGLSSEKTESGETNVILRRDVAASILRTFSSVFSADAAQKGMSLLKDREGEIIASDKVTIVDDALNPASPGACTFDGEGVAIRKLSIVENGKLNTLLHNLKTAKKQGVETTGSAVRGSYGGSVGVGAHSMQIVPSDITPEELLKKCGNGVYITEVQGLHSGANQISGDFSLGAKGFMIEDGKLTKPVSQITVAGNFFKLLEKVTAVASNLEFGFSSVASPDLLVEKLSVSGK